MIAPTFENTSICQIKYEKKREYIVRDITYIGQRHNRTERNIDQLTISADSQRPNLNFQLFAIAESRKENFIKKIEEMKRDRGERKRKKRIVTFLRVFFVDERVGG